jgi:superfamily II DNA or RNA helicase
MHLRPYQLAAVDHVVDFAASATAGSRLLLAAPTGTGKSVIELEASSRLRGRGVDVCIVTPRIEIICGMIEKSGVTVPTRPDDIVQAGLALHITTPMRLRSALIRGDMKAPDFLILDEGHHDNASTWQDLHLLTGNAPAVNFTATPFRGTPKGTAEFRARWGEPTWIITLAEAVAAGYSAFPVCRTVPLLDDDSIEVRNGELIVEELEQAYRSRIEAIVELARPWCMTWWDRPTMFSVPSRAIAHELTAALIAADLPAACVVGETPFAIRQAAFSGAVSCVHALVQVNVLSEGVDLPLRRLVDCSPCMSPVRWVQQVGRITRPTETAPEYVCTNRNLLRHGYLLDGLLPLSKFVEAEQAFGTPSKRMGARVVGLEGLGRLRPVEVPLASGCTALGYALSTTNNNRTTQYFALALPDTEMPVWAKRSYTFNAAGEFTYGKWVRCDPPDDTAGLASIPPKRLSDKQSAWWARAAKRHGLDPDGNVNAKNFVALPVLSDLGIAV